MPGVNRLGTSISRAPSGVLLFRSGVSISRKPALSMYAWAALRALARSIVADIALYNEAEIALYLKEGRLGSLAAALDEGRRLLAATTNPDEYVGEDPIGQAFRALVALMQERGR